MTATAFVFDFDVNLVETLSGLANTLWATA